MQEEELKKKIGIVQKMLDILRKALNIQTQLDKLRLEELIRKIAKEEGADPGILLATIKCESGLNPKAVCKNTDGTEDYGICQFNSYWYVSKGAISKEECFIPEIAIRLMAKRFAQGWARDWVCFKTKKYLGFLKS